MKLVRSLTVALAGTVICAAAAAAQTEDLQFVSGGSTVSNGVYVGPYQARVTSLPGQPLIDIFCVDYYHEVYNNETWTANVQNLGTSSLSLSRLGGSGLQQYLEAAYLASQFASQPTTDWGAIDFAIWNITSGAPIPAGLSGGTGAGSASWWVNQAQTFWGTVDPNQWILLTDVNAYSCAAGTCTYTNGGTQEFLTHVTPERGTMLLFGTGLLGVVIAGIIKRQSAVV